MLVVGEKAPQLQCKSKWVFSTFLTAERTLKTLLSHMLVAWSG